MKKFFKALALVLALALVVGVVPAQSASAKIKAKKVLYTAAPLGWSTTDDTLKSSLKTKVRIYTLAGDKKAAAEDHEYKAVIKSGEGIVEVTKKYVVGKNLGKAVVEIFKDGESLGTSVITVRKNADASTLKLQVKDGDAFVDVTADTTFVAGVTYRLALPRAKADSDERRLTVDDKAIEDVEGSARQYDVTFDEGEHTIAFEAFQGGVLDGATAQDSIKITAKTPAAKSAKQVSANSFEVTFDSAMKVNGKDLITKDNVANQDIYYLIAKQPVVTGVVKSVTVSEKDPKVATIEMYATFTEGSDVYFSFKGTEPVKFTTAKNTLKEVDSIEITTTTATVGLAKTIAYKLYNKDGVELSLTNPGITFEQVDGTDKAYVVGNVITFFAEGDVKIKATLFIDYDSTTFETIYKDKTATITGVPKSAATQTELKYSFGVEPAKEKHTIRLDDVAKQFQVKYTYSDNSVATNVGAGANMTISGNPVDQNFKLQSADERVVMIAGADTVKPVSQGETTIILYQYTNNAWVAVGAFPIAVLPGNRVSVATAEVSKTTFNRTTEAGNGPVLKITAKDLDNQAIGLNVAGKECEITVKQLANNAAATGVTLTSTTNKTKAWAADLPLTFSGTPTNKFAPVTFSVTIVDTVTKTTILEKTLSVTVADIAGNDASYTHSFKIVTDETSLDSSIKNYATNPFKSATVEINEVVSTSYGDFFIADGVWDARVESYAAIPARVATNGATGYAYNYLIASLPGTKNVTVTTGAGSSVVINNYPNSENYNNRTVAGNYIITGYRVKYDADGLRTGTPDSLGQAAVLVSRNDATPTIAIKTTLDGTQERGTADYFKTNVGTPAKIFTISWDGHTSDETSSPIAFGALTVDVDYMEDQMTHAIIVKTVPYTLTINGTNVYTDKIAVNKLFKNE